MGRSRGPGGGARQHGGHDARESSFDLRTTLYPLQK